MLNMVLSMLSLAVLVVVRPLFLVAVARWIAPYVPGSEFSLLVMAGIVAAYVSYQLGAYYLVGAFIVGLVARLLQVRVPQLAPRQSSRTSTFRIIFCAALFLQGR